MFWDWKRFFLLLAGISFITFFICGICVICDFVSPQFHGFGVDSEGRLYVGLGRSIAVYENGDKIYEIRRNYTRRGYVFTVQPDDTLIICSGNSVCTVDLKGNEIIEPWEEDAWTADRIKTGKYYFRSSDGRNYTARRPLGRLTIYQEDAVIYQMPLVEYILVVLLIVSIPCFAVSVFVIRHELYKWFL